VTHNFTISFTIFETMNLDFDEDFRIDFIYMNMMLNSMCWTLGVGSFLFLDH